MTTSITVAYGDAPGPDTVEAALHILREAGADFSVETIEVGQRIYHMGSPTGILPSSWEQLSRTGILLKGPTQPPEPQHKDVTAALLHTLHRTGEIERQDYGDFTAYTTEGFVLFDAGDTMLGALKAALAMLSHTGQPDIAARIDTAWRRTVSEGIHTIDLYDKRKSREKVSAQEFAQAVAERLLFFPRPLGGEG